jgi:predicted transcriptional regulator
VRSVFANRKRRGSEEIIASIVFNARNGASKTAIMYASYLSFAQLQKYISFGLKAKLIYQNSEGKYMATPRGLEYLRRFEEVKIMEDSAASKRKLLDEILDQEAESY